MCVWPFTISLSCNLRGARQLISHGLLGTGICSLKIFLRNFNGETKQFLLKYQFVFPFSCFMNFYSGKPTTLCETMGKAEMWLIRTSWDFEFPHPSLPNFEYVGGLHCKPAKPLPKVFKRAYFCLFEYLLPGIIL